MSKPEYYSGPWIVESISGGILVKQLDGGWISQDICKVYCKGTWETSKGTAMIIRAAPVMHEALKEITKILEFNCITEGDTLAAQVKQVAQEALEEVK